MKPAIRPCWFFLLALTLGISLALGREWERKLVIMPDGPDVQRSQSSGEEEEAEDGESEGTEEAEEAEYKPTVNHTEAGLAQKVSRTGARLSASYNFINFNKDRLSVSYGMADAEYKRYLAGYGYTDAEMQALRDWKKKARDAAWYRAYATGGKPAAEKAVTGIDMDYDTRMRALLRARGMALRAETNTVESDVPAIVKRNTQVMQPLALAIQKLGNEKHYGSEEMVGAVLSLVQTALIYKIPPMIENGVHTGGLLPPARTILGGWGDCDTKTALMASVLSSWNTAKMVGVAVPGHYLMAIRRLPAKGDAFVRYEGLEYVLVEPAGPAWLEPGQVGRHTIELLEGSEGYKIEPFF